MAGSFWFDLLFNHLGYSLSVEKKNPCCYEVWQPAPVAGDPDMQSSINHVSVLVVFFFHTSPNLGHPPPPSSPSACHFTRSCAWAHHMKDDICIGLCGGEIGYCSCFLSLLHSLLSLTQFLNFHLLSEGFFYFLKKISILVALLGSLRNILLLIHDFTRIHTWRVGAYERPESTSTWVFNL